MYYIDLEYLYYIDLEYLYKVSYNQIREHYYL